MPTIIIEFGTPNANQKALLWRKHIVEALEKAMKEFGAPDQKLARLFQTAEYSVYMTFETPREHVLRVFLSEPLEGKGP